MKLNKLAIALSCLLVVPAVSANKVTDILNSGYNKVKSALDVEKAKKFASSHKKAFAIGGAAATAIGIGAALYYKNRAVVNAKVKAAANTLVEKAKNAAKFVAAKFNGLSTKAKVGVVTGAVAAPAAAYLGYKYGKQYFNRSTISA